MIADTEQDDSEHCGWKKNTPFNGPTVEHSMWDNEWDIPFHCWVSSLASLSSSSASSSLSDDWDELMVVPFRLLPKWNYIICFREGPWSPWWMAPSVPEVATAIVSIFGWKCLVVLSRNCNLLPQLKCRLALSCCCCSWLPLDLVFLSAFFPPVPFHLLNMRPLRCVLALTKLGQHRIILHVQLLKRAETDRNNTDTDNQCQRHWGVTGWFAFCLENRSPLVCDASKPNCVFGDTEFVVWKFIGPKFLGPVFMNVYCIWFVCERGIFMVWRFCELTKLDQSWNQAILFRADSYRWEWWSWSGIKHWVWPCSRSAQSAFSSRNSFSFVGGLLCECADCLRGKQWHRGFYENSSFRIHFNFPSFE